MQIEIDPVDLGTLCIAALRYSMGRSTYMPSLVRGIVRPLLPELSDRDIRVMHEDCAFQASTNQWGDERIDKPGWILWREELRKEMERRGME